MPVDFVCCDAEPCKCAAPDDPDLCACELGAGAALIDGAPCAKCGAPLDVVMAPELPAAPASVQRAALTFSAELAPGEQREIELETSVAFKAERLTFARPPQTRWQRAIAAFVHVCRLPLLIWSTARAVRWSFAAPVLERFDDDPPAPSRWRELRGRLADIWRVPWPAPPVELVNLHVGAVGQFIGSPIPAEIFSVTGPSPHLLTDTAQPGQLLTLTVRSTSRRPYKVHGAITGSAFTGPRRAAPDVAAIRELLGKLPPGGAY